MLLCFPVVFPGSASPINLALLHMPSTVLSSAAYPVSEVSFLLWWACVCVGMRGESVLHCKDEKCYLLIGLISDLTSMDHPMGFYFFISQFFLFCQ